ncbi:MAG: alanine dehydrogenase [Chloroflexi bacterium]|nr:alanine dehydrogenase [Chloroflexota bacterium]MBM3154601.1 alanine dehydrogenase [Chloroflexota bacterium]MBM3173508.1 alanine dehydrogenase [Chloroflexota bacterium]MBM3175695.1 alanine dehydrogenase [Chloroflexota bacterium]MBM4451198.1 alanine dehydrogenase [Chloroflexota bacterium]
MPTIFLARKDVKELLNMKEILEAVEQAFRDHAVGKAAMPPKAYLSLEQGDLRAMPAAVSGAAGMKWVNSHPQNPSRGLPTVMAVLIVNDPATGYPLAVMDATDLTAYRTGATAAIAAKYLARKDSHTLGIVGAGKQAYTQLMAHAEMFDLKLVKVFDLSPAATQKFVQSFPEFTIQATSLEDAVAADILCTLTPAREPVVKKEWVKPGTHINAVGADGPGKQELDPLILKEAMMVVDNMEQAVNGGEINVPLKKGVYSTDQVYATLDEVVAGKKTGRGETKAVTVFDSTGLAIEDIAVASLVYKKARALSKYLTMDFVEE